MERCRHRYEATPHRACAECPWPHLHVACTRCGFGWVQPELWKEAA